MAGYVTSGSTSLSLAAATPTVVATITPAAAANYEVNAFADFFPTHTGLTDLKCGVENANHTSSTTFGGGEVSQDVVGQAVTTGIVHGSAGNALTEVCSAANGATFVFNRALDAVQLATANGHAAPLGSHAHGRSAGEVQAAANKFRAAHQK